MEKDSTEMIGKGKRTGATGGRIDPFTGEPITYHYLNTARARRGQTEEDAITRARKRRRGMLKKYRPMIMSLLFVALAGILLSRGTKNAGFAYREHLGDVAVTMAAPDGGRVSLDLKDLAYYVWKIERDGDVRARAYDPKDPKVYWNLFLNDEGDQSGYMSDLGREAVVDYAVRDTIYVLEAERNGFALTQEQERDAVLEADRYFLDQSEKAKEALQLSRDELIDSVKKETLARQYMLYLYDNGQKEIDVGGAEYETLKSAYGVTVEEEIVKGIRIGYVTIN
ncbi:MAG: hypothetical protein IKO10_02700 [Lachnospiraceae bacterium]|nr:hypothetical protein [Lachnospiraceae bacterium]